MKGHPAIRQSVTRSAKALEALALKIHANPELGLAEHKAVRWQTPSATWPSTMRCPRSATPAGTT